MYNIYRYFGKYKTYNLDLGPGALRQARSTGAKVPLGDFCEECGDTATRAWPHLTLVDVRGRPNFKGPGKVLTG